MFVIHAVPVVRETWAVDAGNSIVYYSDSEDISFSTVDIGVPNTERGKPTITLIYTL